MRIEIICPTCSSEFSTDKLPCICPECSRQCGEELDTEGLLGRIAAGREFLSSLT